MASDSSNQQTASQAQPLDDVAAAEAPSLVGDAELAEQPLPFVPPPIREDQVDNAVKFLSHPKVKGSPVQYRRSFLERKGLSTEEIDEAFSRVPDPETGSAHVEATVSGPLPTAGGPSPATTVTTTTTTTRPAVPPRKPWEQAAQPAAQPLAAPTPQFLPPGVQPAPGQQYALQPVHTAGPPPPPPPVAGQGGFRWGQMALAIAVLGGIGAGGAVLGQKYAVPWMRSGLRRFVLGDEAEEKEGEEKKPGLAEEAAATAAAAAASMSAIARELVQSRQDEKERGEALLKAMQDTKEVLASVKEALTTRDSGLSLPDLRRELRTFAAVAPEFSHLAANGVEQPPPPLLPPQESSHLAANGVERLQSLVDEVKGLLPLLSASAEPAAAPATSPLVQHVSVSSAPSPLRPLSAAPRAYHEVPTRPTQALEPVPGSPMSAPSEIGSVARRSPSPEDLFDRPIAETRTAPRSKPWERNTQAPLHARQGAADVAAAGVYPAPGASPAAVPWWQQRRGEGPQAAPAWNATSPVYTAAPPWVPGGAAAAAGGGVKLAEIEESEGVGGDAANGGAEANALADFSGPGGVIDQYGQGIAQRASISANQGGGHVGGGQGASSGERPSTRPDGGRGGWVPPTVPQASSVEVAKAIKREGPPPELQERAPGQLPPWAAPSGGDGRQASRGSEGEDGPSPARSLPPAAAQAKGNGAAPPEQNWRSGFEDSRGHEGEHGGGVPEGEGNGGQLPSEHGGHQDGVSYLQALVEEAEG